MEYQIEFTYSPRFVSSTAKAYWLRQYGPAYLCYVGIPLLTFVIAVVTGEISSWIGGLLSGYLLGIASTLGFLFLYQLYHYGKMASAAAEKWRGLDVIFKFEENHIISETDLGAGSYKWELIDKLWQSPQALILFFSEEDYVAIPSTVLSAELQQFIIRKVSEAGGKVVR